jgi:hypothetical protein
VYELSELVHGCPLEFIRRSHHDEFDSRGSPSNRSSRAIIRRSCSSTVRGYSSTQCTYMMRMLRYSGDEKEFECHGSLPSLSLLSVCRTIYQETLPFFYSRNQFKLSPVSLVDVQTALRDLNPLALSALTSFHINLTASVFVELVDGAPFGEEFTSAFHLLCEFLSSAISPGQLSNFSFATSAAPPLFVSSLASSISLLPHAASVAISLGPNPELRSLARSVSLRLSTKHLGSSSDSKPFRFSL